MHRWLRRSVRISPATQAKVTLKAAAQRPVGADGLAAPCRRLGAHAGFGIAGQDRTKWRRWGVGPVLHRTMARVTVALIGAVSAGTAPGCGGSSVGAGESSDDGKPVGVCEGSISKSPAATIRVTRSTNSPELTVAVYCDGSAERTL